MTHIVMCDLQSIIFLKNIFNILNISWTIFQKTRQTKEKQASLKQNSLLN